MSTTTTTTTTPLGDDPIDTLIPAPELSRLRGIYRTLGYREFAAHLKIARESARREQESCERDRQERDRGFRRFVDAKAPNLAADLMNFDGLDAETVARLIYIRQHEHPCAYAAALGEAREAAKRAQRDE
jgi:hypothetical protein